jgi:hypothetical protein
MAMGQPIATGGSGGTTAPAMTVPPAPMAGSSPAGAGGAGSGGTTAAGTGGSSGSGGTAAPVDAGAMAVADAGAIDAGSTDDPGTPLDFAGELSELFLHDACTGDYAPQPDTCLHMQKVEKEVTFGGTTGTVYDVTVRIRGLFEPTTISGGMAPLPDHPYFKVGGTVSAGDYSQWHIKVSNPAQTYWLNHYPSTSHTIYKEDYEATIAIAAGAKVTVGATDGNDREIDNAEMGIADRRQLIDGVTDMVLDGQMLRLDVSKVEAQ